jgi:hypothetical protein
VPDVYSLQYKSWRRDGRSLCGLAQAELALKCFFPDDRRFETLAGTRDLALAVWMYTPWMGLDADGLPFVTADRSTHALYALDWEAP